MGPAPRVHIGTERLLLRDWTDADAEPFAALNADPRVREFFPNVLTAEESDAALAANRRFLDEKGWGNFAVEEKATGRFLGYVGLADVDFAAPFAPAIEIGWRLRRDAWGAGYATEAARAVADDAFFRLGLPEIVSFTAEWNRPSRRVMEKLGMARDPEEDFDHPALPPGHKLRRHVLYRLRRPGRG